MQQPRYDRLTFPYLGDRYAAFHVSVGLFNVLSGTLIASTVQILGKRRTSVWIKRTPIFFLLTELHPGREQISAEVI